MQHKFHTENAEQKCVPRAIHLAEAIVSPSEAEAVQTQRKSKPSRAKFAKLHGSSSICKQQQGEPVPSSCILANRQRTNELAPCLNCVFIKQKSPSSPVFMLLRKGLHLIPAKTPFLFKYADGSLGRRLTPSTSPLGSSCLRAG